MNEKLLLVNAPWRTIDRAGVRAGSRWPFTMAMQPSQDRMGYAPYPFFMAYATAVCEKKDIDVKMVDAIAEFQSPMTFQLNVAKYEPTHIMIETSTPSIGMDLAWASTLKKATGAKIILTGNHATTFNKELIDLDYVDRILLGEYDLSLASSMEFEDDNIIKEIIAPQPVENLDDLPYPAWSHTPMDRYYDATSQLEQPVLNVMASRGCTHACSFCLWPQTMYDREAHWRSRSPEKVVEEIYDARMQYKDMFKGVFFEDDTWGAEADWAWEFVNEYDTPDALPFCILTRADIMDYDLLKDLHRVGLKTFRFGVESGCQKIVDNIGKGLDLACVKQTIDNCNEIGINTEFSICYGFPGETKETVAQTQEFIKKLKPTSLVQALATPYPGTRFFDELDRKGMIETKDWEDYDGFFTATFRSEGLSKAELEGLFRRMTRQ